MTNQTTNEFIAQQCDQAGEVVALQASATCATNPSCFLCNGKGWHYMAHAYPPGLVAPETKVNCVQCAKVSVPVRFGTQEQRMALLKKQQPQHPALPEYAFHLRSYGDVTEKELNNYTVTGNPIVSEEAWVKGLEGIRGNTKATKSLTYEQYYALCEANYNTEADAYFEARPNQDSAVNRRIFYAGHRKAWINYPTIVADAMQLTDEHRRKDYELGYQLLDGEALARCTNLGIALGQLVQPV